MIPWSFLNDRYEMPFLQTLGLIHLLWFLPHEGSGKNCSQRRHTKNLWRISSEPRLKERTICPTLSSLRKIVLYIFGLFT